MVEYKSINIKIINQQLTIIKESRHIIGYVGWLHTRGTSGDIERVTRDDKAVALVNILRYLNYRVCCVVAYKRHTILM